MIVLQRLPFLRLLTMQLVILAGLILITLFSQSPAQAMQHNLTGLSGKNLVQAMQKGGYSIYFRHEATNWSQSDFIQKAGDWLSCDVTRVRQLSAVGRQNAVSTGQAIRKLGIPVGRVLASPYCRTIETASLMKLGKVEPSNDVINMRVAEYFGGRSAIVATARALLARPPKSNTNTVIVAHGNVAQEATPVYPGEGEGIIFQADGQGGFRFVGRLGPTEWTSLANTIQP